MADSLNSNNISYEGFLDGYHILGYDLTTSGDAGGTPFVNPNVRVGDLRVKIDFDKVIVGIMTMGETLRIKREM